MAAFLIGEQAKCVIICRGKVCVSPFLEVPSCHGVERNILDNYADIHVNIYFAKHAGIHVADT